MLRICSILKVELLNVFIVLVMEQSHFYKTKKGYHIFLRGMFNLLKIFWIKIVAFFPNFAAIFFFFDERALLCLELSYIAEGLLMAQ